MQSKFSILFIALFCVIPIFSRETVLEDSPSRLTLEIEVSGYHVNAGTDGSRITADDFSGAAKVGAPELPWYRFQVASGAQTPSVTVEPEEWVELPLSQPLAGIPRWLTPQKSEAQKDPALFSAAAGLITDVSPIQEYRGMSLRSISLSTGTYVEGSGRVKLLKRFRIHVAFSDARPTLDSRVKEWLLQAGIKNVQGGQYLTSLPRTALSKAARAQVHAALGTSHIKIRIGDRQLDGFGEDGVYTLSYEAVKSIIPAATQVRNLRIYAGPNDTLLSAYDSTEVNPTLHEIPIQILDKNGQVTASSSTETFDAGYKIQFYAHGTSMWKPISGATGPIQWKFGSDPYSFDNHYYLDWSFQSDTALRLGTIPVHFTPDTVTSTPQYLRAEHDAQTGACDPSSRFDDETGYDWYWYAKGNCGADPAKPWTITLSGVQLRSASVDTLKGYASGDTTWIGFFSNSQNFGNEYGVWAGSQLAYTTLESSVSGSWYAQPAAIVNQKLGLDSVVWAGSSMGFEGYTIRYKRTLTWDGSNRSIFPAVRGKWVAYKISQGAGLHCLRVEQGAASRLLSVQSSGQDGIFTDSAGAGEDVQYFLYGSPRNLDPNAVALEKIHTEDGVVQNLSNGDNKNPQYVIIAPEALLSEALKLRTYRQDTKRLMPLATSVIRAEDIYREWSGGRMSPTAIRNALRYVLNHWGANGTQGRLHYVLLYGDGHYDYRDILNSASNNPLPNHIPPFNWVTYNSSPTNNNPMSTDDFYGVLGSAGDWRTGLLDVALGRLSLQSLDQARNYLDKVKAYEDPTKAGEWRGRITLTADDATQHGSGGPDGIPHTKESEDLGQVILSHQPGTQLEKVYLFDYPANANFLKPEATQALLTNLNQGTLYLNFFGHGAYNQWADEVLLQTNDALKRLYNTDKAFMVSVFSCTVGRFEKLKDDGMLEKFVRQTDFGAISALGASRESYDNDNAALGNLMVSRLFPVEPDSVLLGIGDAVQGAKNSRINQNEYNKQKYILFGEPVVTIRRPGPAIQVQQVPDTLRALQCGTIKGRIPGGSGHGFISIRILAGDLTKNYLNAPGVIKRGAILFERTLEYKDSAFSMDYFLPKQVPFGDSTAKIQFFAWDAVQPMETNHLVSGLWIKSAQTNAACSVNDDARGPRITVTGCNSKESGSVNFSDRVKISLPYCLQIDAMDSLGGVMSGDGPDEGTTVEVTGVLEPYHPQPSVDDLYHKSYQLTLQNGLMTQGAHLLKISARDGFGNLSLRQLTLETYTDTALRFVKTFNVPNPVKRNGTTFYFSTTLPQDENLDVTGSGGIAAANIDRVRFDLRIFNQLGKMVREFPDAQATGQPWDGKDAWGQTLANGVYFYQVTAIWDVGNGAPVNGQHTSKRNILVLSR